MKLLNVLRVWFMIWLFLMWVCLILMGVSCVNGCVSRVWNVLLLCWLGMILMLILFLVLIVVWMIILLSCLNFWFCWFVCVFSCVCMNNLRMLFFSLVFICLNWWWRCWLMWRIVRFVWWKRKLIFLSFCIVCRMVLCCVIFCCMRFGVIMWVLLCICWKFIFIVCVRRLSLIFWMFVCWWWNLVVIVWLFENYSGLECVVGLCVIILKFSG